MGMDEPAARCAFEDALASYEQDFGTFFLARLFGLEVTYPEGACVITFEPLDFMFNPQGTLHGGVIALVMASRWAICSTTPLARAPRSR